jgi:NRAMP (natural resistance-associated macrophage protein)-like metal ion transporter
VRGLGHGLGRFRRVGPGLVTGAADDDPSGIGTYSQVGAQFGYAFLWSTLLALPLAEAVQQTAARLGLVTGKGLAALIRERFPRPLLLAIVSLVAVANTFNIGADLAAMAAATRLLAPLPQLPLVIGFGVVIVSLEFFLSYHRYAKILRFLTLALLAYLGVLFAARVDWPAVARGTFVPQWPHGRDAWAALLALLGTTISPYLFFWQASEEVEEHGTRPPRRVGSATLRDMRFDVVAGMTGAVVIMFAILVSGAAALHVHGIHEVATADAAARALQPIAGDLAALWFTLGIVGTGLLAVPVLAASSAYALSETFGWREGLSRRLRQAPGFYGVIAASVAVGIALQWVGIDPMRALFLSAILNALAAPPVLLLMLVLSHRHRDRDADPPHRVADALLLLAALVLIAIPLAWLVS